MEVTTGMKIMVRKAVTPLTLALTRMARARADWQGTTMRAKKAVLVSERTKVGSCAKARTKLLRPTNLGGFGETSRVLVKLSTKVSRMGMPRNSARRSSAGEDMSQAVRASLRNAAERRPGRVVDGMVLSFPGEALGPSLESSDAGQS